MKTKFFIALLIMLSFTVAQVSAQSIADKSHNEKQRIVQGVKSGELTKNETKALVKEQVGIRKDIYRAKTDDGKIGPHERAAIKHDQRKASRHIYRAKHNNRDRG